MYNIDSYKTLLEIRTYFKQVDQVTWNIRTLEKRYPLETLTDDEVNSLIKGYLDYIGWLEESVKKLKEIQAAL